MTQVSGDLCSLPHLGFCGETSGLGVGPEWMGGGAAGASTLVIPHAG